MHWLEPASKYDVGVQNEQSWEVMQLTHPTGHVTGTVPTKLEVLTV